MYVHAEAKCLLSVNKRVLPASHLVGAPCACQRITSTGLQTKGPAPRPPLFDKGHHDHSDRSGARGGNGSPRVLKDEWRGFLMHKSQVTNMNGQEVNFICLVCRGSPCRAVFSTSCRSRVLGGIARPCRGWKEERARAWNLGGPLTFIGIKKQYSTLDKHAYTYTHKHGNRQETIHTKGFLSLTAHRVCAWLCT